MRGGAVRRLDARRAFCDRRALVSGRALHPARERTTAALATLVVPDNEGRSRHEVDLGGRDAAFEHGPGDLHSAVWMTDPETGEAVDTGYVAVERGRDDGNVRFDVVPKDALARTGIADSMPNKEVYPAHDGDPDDTVPVGRPADPQKPVRTPPSIPQEAEDFNTPPSQDRSDDLPQGTIVNSNMLGKDDEQLQKGLDDWLETEEARKLANRRDPAKGGDPINGRIQPSESYIWKQLGKADRPGRKKDAKGNLYAWDRGGNRRHPSQIEKYDKTGRNHLGSFDPLTGKRIGGPDKTKRPLDTSEIDGDRTKFV